MSNSVHLFLGLIVTLMLNYACTVKPEPISHDGTDQCTACKMMISDYAFATELVTAKGRIYKFDAIECLVPYLQENKSVKFKHSLVTNYYRPSELIEASAAYYLKSPEIDSPMGGHLAAFESQESAQLAQEEYSGTIYSWAELIALKEFQ